MLFALLIDKYASDVQERVTLKRTDKERQNIKKENPKTVNYTKQIKINPKMKRRNAKQSKAKQSNAKTRLHRG